MLQTLHEAAAVRCEARRLIALLRELKGAAGC